MIKSITLKALAILALSFPVLQAKSNPALNSLKTDAEKVIRNSVSIPSGLKTGEKKVEILFTTNEKGQVNFVLAKTEDPALKKEIEKQFYRLRFAMMKTDAVNSVVLNIKTV